jgi:glycosyltransferase involved in cell wall biosynthesis
VHNLVRIDQRGMRISPANLLPTLMIRRAETRLIRRLDHVHVTTSRLAEAVMRLHARARPHVVPIALDPSLYEFRAEDTTSAPVIGFLATMSWPPGYLAAIRMITRVFPRIRARRPDARLLLVGWNARTRLARYLDRPGVEIVENVPDAAAYFRRLQVFAYPLPQGSGMMAKILEAMAYGVPIVTTNEGIEGYGIKDGVHALVTDDDADFAERVVELLDDAALRCSLREQARRLVQESHAPRATGAAMETVHEAIGR